jgi:hypothetical protein
MNVKQIVRRNQRRLSAKIQLFNEPQYCFRQSSYEAIRAKKSDGQELRLRKTLASLKHNKRQKKKRLKKIKPACSYGPIIHVTAEQIAERMRYSEKLKI